MKLNLTGLVAAPHTPFHEDFRLHPAVIARQAESLRVNNVAAAFVCGTTGEGYSLTLEERKIVAAEWCRARGGSNLKVIVNVSHLCAADSRELAVHAARSGADAFAIMAPGFFKPAGIADLVEFAALVASAAPDLPFFFYHMPGMTGVNFPMADFLPRAAERIPNFAGIKFTSEDLMDYGRCRAAAGNDFDVLFGRDEILLSALALGAAGAIGSTYNFAAPLYHDVVAAYRRGDMPEAQRQQARAMEMVAVLGRHGGMAAGKAAMKTIGIDCGPVRLPLRQPGPADLEGLFQGLGSLGVLSSEYVSGSPSGTAAV